MAHVVRKFARLNTGAEMPIIGLGTWQMRSKENDDVVNKAVNNALNLEYRMFDTATIYKNEKDLGRSLKEHLPKYNLARSDIFITSKLSTHDHGHDSAYNACLESIKNLDCGYLDLYLIHWPGASKVKREDPINKEYRKQSWMALEKLYKEGHCKAIGVSNYMVKHLEEMINTYATVVPAVNQVELHPYLYQKEVLDYCKSKNIVFQAYSSLGVGKIIGDDVFVELAKKYNKTPAQILYRWALEHNVAIIPKSTNPDHMRENLNLFNFTLLPEDISKMNELSNNTRFCWDPNEVA